MNEGVSVTHYQFLPCGQLQVELSEKGGNGSLESLFRHLTKGDTARLPTTAETNREMIPEACEACIQPGQWLGKEAHSVAYLKCIGFEVVDKEVEGTEVKKGLVTH
jgi:hypothetical protein